MAKDIVRKLSFLICKSYKYSIVFRTFAKENQHKNISQYGRKNDKISGVG